jgi:hypothetical protein
MAVDGDFRWCPFWDGGDGYCSCSMNNFCVGLKLWWCCCSPSADCGVKGTRRYPAHRVLFQHADEQIKLTLYLIYVGMVDVLRK